METIKKSVRVVNPDGSIKIFRIELAPPEPPLRTPCEWVYNCEAAALDSDIQCVDCPANNCEEQLTFEESNDWWNVHRTIKL